MNDDILMYISAVIAGLILLRKVYIRLQLSQAKHSSLRGHAKWSRRIAKLVPYFEYGEDRFFCSDGAPADIAGKRRDGMEELRRGFQETSAGSRAFNASLESSISDIRFTSAYRVPFPFRNYLAPEFKRASIVDETDGVRVKDIDGNWRYDVFGSYGVNVFGYDFYKSCMEVGFDKVKKLGPVLGPYHPLIRENVDKLRAISGLDEVSFHMSGTEAVMQAVRLARYHTGRTHLVRFCGAYHGWWDGVQPGVGNQRKTNDVYTLADISEKSLRVLRTRDDIACVLINPLQGLHPNADASSDASLIASTRSAYFDRKAYSSWLKQVREVCAKHGIVFIMDEVFCGFRLAYRGAQEYYGVRADIVTYGKTLGGGLPVGVVCGRDDLMKRFRDDQPANISFARGTFNSHPYVMASMNEFLRRIGQAEYQAIYQNADALWNARVVELNTELEQNDLPVHVVNLHSIWTITYTLPCRYNWMLQFYLRAEGLELSWVGSGRFIMSLNYSDDDYAQVKQRFLRSAQAMKADGWWWQSAELSNRSIKHQMLKDMFQARFPVFKKLLDAQNHVCGSSSLNVPVKEVQEQ